jgi:hypothetical protein
LGDAETGSEVTIRENERVGLGPYKWGDNQKHRFQLSLPVFLELWNRFRYITLLGGKSINGSNEIKSGEVGVVKPGSCTWRRVRSARRGVTGGPIGRRWTRGAGR